MKNKKDKKFDLEERTQIFFIKVIDLCKTIPINPITKRQIDQVIGSSGSVGANWREASESESKKDFVHKIKIARKEAKESQLWLNGLKRSVNKHNQEFDNLINESKELVYILTSIINKVSKK